jgi:hypothetical protein
LKAGQGMLLAENILLFLPKLLWDSGIIILAVWLTILWVGFLFGSVLGVVLVLIFLGLEGFLFPLALLGFCTPIWKNSNDQEA